MREEAEAAEAIVEAHEDDAAPREVRAVVDGRRAAAVDEAAAVDPDHHRQLRRGRLLGRPDVEVEAVLARAACRAARRRSGRAPACSRWRRRVAWRTPVQAGAGRGARQRRSPIGGAANGTPSRRRRRPRRRPPRGRSRCGRGRERPRASRPARGRGAACDERSDRQGHMGSSSEARYGTTERSAWSVGRRVRRRPRRRTPSASCTHCASGTCSSSAARRGRAGTLTVCVSPGLRPTRLNPLSSRTGRESLPDFWCT